MKLAPYKGDIQYRKQGSLIAFESGEAITYGLYNAQERRRSEALFCTEAEGEIDRRRLYIRVWPPFLFNYCGESVFSSVGPKFSSEFSNFGRCQNAKRAVLAAVSLYSRLRGWHSGCIRLIPDKYSLKIPSLPLKVPVLPDAASGCHIAEACDGGVMESTKERLLSLMEQYEIGKKPLSRLLGWGETTVMRYLDGVEPI